MDKIERLTYIFTRQMREKGAMDARTMQSFKTEMFKRCLIELDEVTGAFFGW